MSPALRIGVDVGGTNTDAVALLDREVRSTVKCPTSADVLTGVVDSVRQLLTDVNKDEIGAVMIGTTHFTNAVVEAKNLAEVGILRLAGTTTQAVPPLLDWPERLRAVVEGHTAIVAGGHEYDGRELAPPQADEIRAVARRFQSADLHSVAVTGVFSPVRDHHERMAACLIRETAPGLSVSLSAEIGRLGLIERENATVLNAALQPLAGRIIDALHSAVSELGIDAPLYLSQNDGTLMGSAHSREYPVATFASGPTNSMRGASFLSGVADCAVIDIGGTTTDIGVLRHGFPREASMAVEIGGVRTNFRMPDIHSIGIGGGSIVRAGSSVTVGPDSVGHRLTDEAMVFGGDTLTATDIAVASGIAMIGDPRRVADLDRRLVSEAAEIVRHEIAAALDRIKVSPDPIPVVLVGGGAVLVSDDLPGAAEVHRPDHSAVANAIGAALAQVGGRVDRIVALENISRGDAVRAVEAQAVERCVEAGADLDSVRIVDVEQIPLAYLPSNAVRFTVRAIGDLD